MAERLKLPNRRIRDPYIRWCGRGEAVRSPPIPIDMTSAVKRWLYDGTWGFIVLGFHGPSLRAAAEPEPVMPTVDHADIRGLATT